MSDINLLCIGWYADMQEIFLWEKLLEYDKINKNSFKMFKYELDFVEI